jgi:hypothetical protein
MRLLLATGGRFPTRGACLVLALAIAVLGAAAVLRSAEYDESYSVLVTSEHPRPAWPRAAFTPAEAWAPFAGKVGPATIARHLRRTDVHPPLYFWVLGAWRHVAGDSLLALRLLSVALSAGAVAAWMAAAWRAGLPPLAVGLGTALAYGFAYTGHIARGFALAHLLLALTALAAVEAWRRRGQAASAVAWAAAAGLAAGLASFTNYLAVFPAAVVLAWLVLAPSDGPGLGWAARLRLALAAGAPFAALQAGNLHFYLAQAGSRAGQFEPFSALPALLRLAQFNAANLFGGLPL